MKRLLERRQRVVAGLPPIDEILRGSVFVRTLRCGKTTCHCATGKGHQVAYLSVTLAAGRTEQISLPAHLVPLAREWVGNYSKWWRIVERVSAINREVLRAKREQGRAGAGKAIRGARLVRRRR